MGDTKTGTKRYELSIKACYRSWGVWEGIRELVQNAHDGAIEHDTSYSVNHVYRRRNGQPMGAVIMITEGVTVPKEAFLIGHSSKDGRSDLAGKFGEGFKYGILSLLREGLEVKIRNGSETWNPAIVRSKDYDAEVLAFDVAFGNKDEKRFQVEVLGISQEQWQEMQKKFLFLSPLDYKWVIKTDQGNLINHPDYRGKCYDKGIYICTIPELNFGYDFKYAEIDSERKFVSDLYSQTCTILSRAISTDAYFDKIFSLMLANSGETNYLSSYYFSSEVKEKIVQRFLDTYGDNAIPAVDEEQRTALAHFGVKGVLWPHHLRSVVEQSLGTATRKLADLKFSVRYNYSTEELEEQERNNLEKAKQLLLSSLASEQYECYRPKNIEVVDFFTDNLYGTFHEGHVKIARKVLSQGVPKLLRVLIHECAHILGVDGTKTHEEAIGEITELLLKQLLIGN